MEYQNPAEERLKAENLTCAVWKDDLLYIRDGIGVKPLMALLQEDRRFFEGAYVADKVIGKAAALLILYGGGARAVYGGVMSDTAAHLLEERGVPFRWGERVPFIKNRTETGMCPLEEAVKEITEPEEAYEALCKRIAELMATKK